MARVYTLSTEGNIAALAATRELLAFKVATSQVVELLRARWGAASSEDSKQLKCRIGVLTADVAGATAVTTGRKNPGDAAHGLSNVWKDGTLGTVATDGWVHQASDDQRIGWDYHPTPDELQEFIAGNVVGLGLLEAPSAAIDVWAEMIIRVRGA